MSGPNRSFHDYDVSKRGPSYNAFIGHSDPTFALSVRLDVTELFSWCKTNKRSFFTEFLYLVSKVANSIENFRVRFVDGRPVVYDTVDPGYIVFRDDDTIATCRTEYTEDREVFYRDVRETVERLKDLDNPGGFNDDIDDNAVLFTSCLPWTDFLSVKNPYDLKDMDSCSIPRMVWGKVVDEGGRLRMTMDVAAHHSLMDGYHLSLFYNRLQEELDGFIGNIVEDT